jgi:hypothetical protein
VAELFVFYQTHLPDVPVHKIHFRLCFTAAAATTTTTTTTTTAPLPRSPLRRLAPLSAMAAADAELADGFGAGPGGESDDDGAAAARALAGAQAAAAATAAATAAFDVRHARTALASDKARLLALIAGSGDSIGEFNAWAKAMVSKKAAEAAERERAHASPGLASKALHELRARCVACARPAPHADAAAPGGVADASVSTGRRRRLDSVLLRLPSSAAAAGGAADAGRFGSPPLLPSSSSVGVGAGALDCPDGAWTAAA